MKKLSARKNHGGFYTGVELSEYIKKMVLLEPRLQLV